MRRSRLLTELQPFVVPGWQIDHARTEIVEVKTVLGAYQRGQAVLLRCQRQDCRRRVEIELRAAVHAGHGDRTIAFLIDLLRCRHWGGCELAEVSTTYPKGVPLVGYLQHRDVLIAIACAGCGGRVLLPPKQVILRLKAARRGDGSTGILELGRVVRGPCGKCGRSQFEAQVVWPSRTPA